MRPYILWIPFCLVQPSEFQHIADMLISSGGSLSSMSDMQKFTASKNQRRPFLEKKKKKERWNWKDSEQDF